jgi:predicted nucleic acid-binding protein
MIVIADTSPLNYLILIGEIDVIPRLYGRVIIPSAVLSELQSSQAPKAIREWIRNPPEWLEVRQATVPKDTKLENLGPGEREAIVLAEQLRATALIMDERAGRREAERRNLRVVGTLFVLFEAAGQGLIDFPEAVRLLQREGFHASSSLIQSLLNRHRERTPQESK